MKGEVSINAKKLIPSWGAIAIAMFALTFVLILFLAPAQSVDANTGNMASSYTVYKTQQNFWTGAPEYSFKYVWNSSYNTTLNQLNSSYKYIDSWQGPTDMTREEKVTSGTTRTTSFSGSASYKKYVQATIGYSYASSSSSEVSKTFTFPGDEKLHTLYVTRRHIDRENYTWCTAYRAPVKSYTGNLVVGYWNIVWGTYSRYSSGDVARYKSASTTEYQFGNRMT